MSKRKYKTDPKSRLFTKYYFDSGDRAKIALEYEKGLKISSIINYPTPISFDQNSIQYEYIDIKFSLYDLLKSGKSKQADYYMIGKYLSIMHDNSVLHGDFTPINIVFDQEGKIYFIDASFSKYNNDNKVVECGDAYKDLSLFLMHLKLSKPLFKPWLFFQINKNKKHKIAFLRGYFKEKHLEEFNIKKYLIFENQFIRRNLRYHRDSKQSFPVKMIWHLILNYNIVKNNIVIWLKKNE